MNKIISHFYLHATNVHTGGGATLLRALLRILPDTLSVTLDVDARFNFDFPQTSIVVSRVKPTIFSRLKSAYCLWRKVKSGDRVLCFGNLPPLFPCRGKVIVLLHNSFLVNNFAMTRGFSFRARARTWIERQWLLWRRHAASRFIVQTPSMEILLRKLLGEETPISVIPFCENQGIEKIATESQVVVKDYDFIYVTSYDAHKNYWRLLEAWKLLAKAQVSPRLCLVSPPKAPPAILQKIKKIIEENRLNIDIKHAACFEAVWPLYQRARALIFVSYLESFGLPLLEAEQAGLPILAGELDFVRDIVNPVETFDPYSALSIARAVKRFLGVTESPLVCQDLATFLNKLLSFE